MTRVAVVWVNYGPCHMARARALAKVQGLDTVFVELASQERLRPWEAGQDAIPGRTITLMDGAFESHRPRTLSHRLLHSLEQLCPDVVVVSSLPNPSYAIRRPFGEQERSCLYLDVGLYEMGS